MTWHLLREKRVGRIILPKEATKMTMTYLETVGLLPDDSIDQSIYQPDDPIYQPQEFLMVNEMCNYSQDIIKCLACNTIINWHPSSLAGSCPFCHRDYDSGSVQVLSAAPLKGLVDDELRVSLKSLR